MKFTSCCCALTQAENVNNIIEVMFFLSTDVSS
ncbi:Uncharacterised protein [Vibrio cholerae]|nr:Uncharacterised protein [Vibrio cholerae]